jgi:HEAT repeat protein/predicted MFS family arabinose efflux permease
MHTELTMLDKYRALPLWISAAIFRSIYLVTVTGTILILYLRQLGMDIGKIGTLLSIMPFLGVFALIIAPYVEQMGLKRTCVIFSSVRIFVTALLIGVPLCLGFGGEGFVFWVIAVIFVVFSLANYTFATADGPWSQQLIPSEVRGRIVALLFMSVGAATAATLALAGVCIKFFSDLHSFQLIIAAGVVFGLIGAVLTSRLPGGLPEKKQDHAKHHLRSMLAAVKDKEFNRVMMALTMIHLSATATMTFTPLYMKDIVGLSNSQVVVTAFCGSIVLIAGYYFWGWAADRYGAKTIFLINTIAMLSFAPLWYVMKLPDTLEVRLSLAVFVAVYGAVFGSGWIIGFDKYLYNNVLPPSQKTSYISVVHAWSGLAAGAGPLLAGWFVASCEGLDRTVLGLRMDPYTPLFLVYLLILAAAIFFISRLKPDSDVSATQFAGMFLQPGPLSAMSTVLRYRFAKDESERVEKTRMMGVSSNPLNIEELIESLNDPSFNVRYEAVITIANRKPSPQLTGALIDILLDPDPELASSAAWALGRIGDTTAIPALRESLAIPYPLVQARAARSLGMLQDIESASMLMSWLQTDAEPPLKRACAASLGALQYLPALMSIVKLLTQTRRLSYRGELATAAARIIGSEQRYIKLLRDCKADLNTAAGSAMLDIKKALKKKYPTDSVLLETVETGARYFAKGDLKPAFVAMGQVIDSLQKEPFEPAIVEVLGVFSQDIAAMTEADVEIISLALHTCGSITNPQNG